MVHGDDFDSVGPDQLLGEVRKTLEDKYKIKVEMLGSGAEHVQEIRILNKVVRVMDKGIELEADPRHAELVVNELGLGLRGGPLWRSGHVAARRGGTVV